MLSKLSFLTRQMACVGIFLAMPSVAAAGVASDMSGVLSQAFLTPNPLMLLAQLTPSERDELRIELRRRAREWAQRERLSDQAARNGMSAASRVPGMVGFGLTLTDREHSVLREQLRRLHTGPRPVPRVKRFSAGETLTPVKVLPAAGSSSANDVASDSEERLPLTRR